jgi:hypothetical protein
MAFLLAATGAAVAIAIGGGWVEARFPRLAAPLRGHAVGLIVLSGLDSVPIEPVLTFLNDNRVQDSSVRVRALELLSEHGQNDPRVRDLLRRIARSDKDQEVRESAQGFLEDLAP